MYINKNKKYVILCVDVMSVTYIRPQSKQKVAL